MNPAKRDDVIENLWFYKWAAPMVLWTGLSPDLTADVLHPNLQPTLICRPDAKFCGLTEILFFE
jgi:hypothetical protein